jgi:hypothetical protein
MAVCVEGIALTPQVHIIHHFFQFIMLMSIADLFVVPDMPLFP